MNASAPKSPVDASHEVELSALTTAMNVPAADTAGASVRELRWHTRLAFFTNAMLLGTLYYTWVQSNSGSEQTEIAKRAYRDAVEQSKEDRNKRQAEIDTLRRQVNAVEKLANHTKDQVVAADRAMAAVIMHQRRKLAIYEVLARDSSKAPITLQDLITACDEVLREEGSDTSLTESDLMSALLELTERKVVLATGDGSYVLLREQHMASPPNPDAQRILSSVRPLFDVIASKGVEELLQNPAEANPFKRGEANPYMRGQTLQRAMVEIVGKINGGISAGDLYARLKEKGLVDKAEYTEDFEFLSAVNTMSVLRLANGSAESLLYRLNDPAYKKPDPFAEVGEDPEAFEEPKIITDSERRDLLRKKIMEFVGGQDDGVLASEVYDVLREAGLVSEKQYTQDYEFVSAVNHLCVMKMIDGNIRERLVRMNSPRVEKPEKPMKGTPDTPPAQLRDDGGLPGQVPAPTPDAN